MKLAVFGATGRTGRPLVGQALERGSEVVALARDPSKLGVDHGRLTLVEGDVTDPTAVDRVVAGAEAVLSVIGRKKGSPEGMQTAATERLSGHSTPAAFSRHHRQ